MKETVKKLLKVNVSKIYIIFIFLISISITLGYYSYALFTVSKEKENAISITTGGLNYTIKGENITNNKLEVAKNNVTRFTLTLTGTNKIDSKYQLYYEKNENIEVYYDSNNDQSTGTILSTSKPKTIEIIVYNRSNTNQTVKLGVQGGLLYNDLVLDYGRESINEIQNYNINTASITGGSIEVVNNAVVGEEVEITTTANTNFSYAGCYIKDKNNNILQTLDTNTKTFTMTGEDIIVSPKWKYDDKIVFYVDESSDGDWTYQYTDGATSYFLWDSSRYYINISIHTSSNARRAMWSSKTYDLTNYKTYYVVAYEYTIDSSYNVNNYHNSMYAGVTKTDIWVSNCSNKVAKNGAGDGIGVYFYVDISKLTGAYYLGFEVLSNYHPQGVNFVHAILIGKTYE